MVQQACVIALHEIFSGPQETSSKTLVTDSIALLAADKLCVPVKPFSSSLRHENVDQHVQFTAREFAVERQSVACFDQQLQLTDNNNNFGRDDCDNEHSRSVRLVRLTSFVPSSPHHAAVACTDSIGTLTEDVGTSSAVDVEASTSCPLLVNTEQVQQNDEESCDALADDISDMSIDIDDEDLEGSGHIICYAEGSEMPTEKEPRCDMPPAGGARDRFEPPGKVQKQATAVSSDSTSQSSSTSSSDVTSHSQSSSSSSRSSDASTASSSTSETGSSESGSTSCSTCSSSSVTDSSSTSDTSSSAPCKSKVTKDSDGGNFASGSHITRPSPTPGTAAISTRQTASGTTSDGLIRFAESANSSGKPSTDASLKSSRLAERSSLADRSGARMHPYRTAQKSSTRRQNSRCSFSFKKYETHRNVQDLLDCHSVHLYGLRKHSKWQVNPRVLVEVVKRNEKPPFSEYKFVRATRSAAQKVLGETDVVDDLEDVPFTADDIKHFDEKKRMAEELDKAFGTYLDEENRN